MAALGYDARWRRARAAFLKLHPSCQWPGCVRAATDVDHIDGLGPLGPRGYDPANWMPLCHGHHSSKTALYDGGFGNKPKPRPQVEGAERVGYHRGGVSPESTS